MYLMILSLACSPAPVEPSPPDTGTTSSGPTLTPFPTVTGPEPEPLVPCVQDPDAVWDCPEPGTICRYAGGGNQVFPYGSTEVTDRRCVSSSKWDDTLGSLQGHGLFLVNDHHAVLNLAEESTRVLAWLPGALVEEATDQENWVEEHVTGWPPNAVIVAWKTSVLSIDVPSGLRTTVTAKLPGGDMVLLPGGGWAYLGGPLVIADASGNVLHITTPYTGITDLADSYPLDDLPFDGMGGIGLSRDGATLYVGDQRRNLIWAVDTDTWIAHHFAGSLAPVPAQYGSFCSEMMDAGYAGDGGPATQAQLACPTDLAVGPDGSVYIGDSGNACIRVVSPDGIIERFAGQCKYPSWSWSTDGDGGPALDASLGAKINSMVISDGFLYFAGLRLDSQDITSVPIIRRIWL